MQHKFRQHKTILFNDSLHRSINVSATL